MSNYLVENVTDRLAVCLDILKKKNADYSTKEDPFKNFKNSEIAGVTMEQGIIVRLMDKISRITVLLSKDPDVVDESIQDTINDAINYLAILGALIAMNAGTDRL